MRLGVAFLQALLMVGGPLAVTAWLRQKWRLPWALWGAGAAAFVASQLVHIPMLLLVGKHLPSNLVLTSLLLGLMAGICEEPARYLVFTRWLRRTERYEEGVLVGLGHGGIESIVLGLLVVLGVVGSLSIPGDAPAAAQAAAHATLDAPIFQRVLAAVERLCAITFHTAMSLIVLAAARQRRVALLGIAIALHTVFDGLAVWSMKLGGMYAAEAVGAGAAVLGAFVIAYVRRDERRQRAAAAGVVDHADEPRTDCAVSTRALTKEFDNQRVAVDAVTLDVQPGRVLALLGPNGAGKTTTVRMLCALIPPSRGTARVAGALVVSEEDKLRNHVGILTETPGLYERLTAYENLDLFAQLYGLDDQTRAQRIEKHLRAFDIWERRDDAVSGFSKGMKQKLAIVRALIHEPDVVFLDEPTSGLDPVASREVEDLVQTLRASGRTILLTTHRLAEAEALADLVAIVRGKLLALDTFANLKQRMFGNEMRFTFAAPLDVEALRTVAGFEQAVWRDDALHVPIADATRDAPPLVKALVERGAAIVSVSEAAHSLEEIYLNLVGNDARSGS